MDETMNKLRALVERPGKIVNMVYINIHSEDPAHVIFTKWMVETSYNVFLHLGPTALERLWNEKSEWFLFDKDNVHELFPNKGYLPLAFILKSASKSQRNKYLGLDSQTEIKRFGDRWWTLICDGSKVPFEGLYTVV
jgi:hypothetical protein